MLQYGEAYVADLEGKKVPLQLTEGSWEEESKTIYLGERPDVIIGYDPRGGR